MQAEDSVKPPSNWSKYGEIYIDERLQIVFICTICRENVLSFAKIYRSYDVTSFWDHIEKEHADRLQIHETFNLHGEFDSYVQSDIGPIKIESRDDRDDSDIYKELMDDPLVKTAEPTGYTIDTAVITIEDSDEEDDQKGRPQGKPTSQGGETALQQSHNPPKEIFENLGLALFEALKYNNESESKSNQSPVIQNCYKMIHNYKEQISKTPSILCELYENEAACGNKAPEQNQRENIPPEQNHCENVQIKTSSFKKENVFKPKHTAKRQCTRVIQCNECRYRMTYEIGFLRHKVEFHTVQGNADVKRCSICLSLVWKKEFKAHKIHHSQQHIQDCILCPNKFIQPDTLLSHYIEHHKILDVNSRNSVQHKL